VNPSVDLIVMSLVPMVFDYDVGVTLVDVSCTADFAFELVVLGEDSA
jgi:hypothetical protein